MGNEWAVSDESISAMQNAASGMEEVTGQLQQDIQILESVFDDNADGLGAHSEDIRTLIEELKEIGEHAEVPVKKLILKMSRSILIRIRHREENRITQGRSR